MNGFEIVGIDPGKEDLLHCTDGEQFYRYTANQRRKQTKQKKYNYIREGLKIRTQACDLTVKQLETTLSIHNKYTCNYELFKAYIRAKIEVLYQADEFYKFPIHRKLRWNSYINRQRSEAKMINKIKERFGTPDRVIIAIGDWSHKGHHMRGKEPTKGKGFRKIFKRAGYQTYLVHEYNTSKICHDCNHEMHKFRYQPSKKPKTLGQNILVHGLLSCNTEHGCSKLWNRDVNGSLNIRSLAIEALNGRERPLAFRRNNFMDGTPPAHEPNSRVES
jgi:transposase